MHGDAQRLGKRVESRRHPDQARRRLWSKGWEVSAEWDQAIILLESSWYVYQLDELDPNQRATTDFLLWDVQFIRSFETTWSRGQAIQSASGKLTFCYGKSQFLLGKSTINPFSIAMLVYRRAIECLKDCDCVVLHVMRKFRGSCCPALILASVSCPDVSLGGWCFNKQLQSKKEAHHQKKTVSTIGCRW